MAQPHDIDTELLTMMGELPVREQTEGEAAQELVDYIRLMATEPPVGSIAARVLAAYLDGGEDAAIEAVASMADVTDDRLRDFILDQAAATVSARRFIAMAVAQ
ncbi:hypothetical protein MEX01_24030 [Methylorubrum extorquens]|jgi:hypothetical protein|uniref:hypothetical protein n=1 Tax=Methylorubrum extorquens TaxID=408 RepID=UPI00116D5BF6|nr:hypothetical protein [Methylorubrum extorquens]GEL41812.1 hypothetical protein MEX01_24030 [Methylorubrum extorquens]